MAKRLFDIVLSLIGLVLAMPVLLVAAVGIRFSSSGPVMYRALRIGAGGRPFFMYKMRTMTVEPNGTTSRITALHDPRVFPFGALLRRGKLDELPQLLNVLLGHMSLVGPRPEDPYFVDHHYTQLQLQTLNVRPGLTSPGTLYQETHGNRMLNGGDTESLYLTRLLSLKLALDLVYVRNVSVWYDITLISRTAWVLLAMVGGRRHFHEPAEMIEARQILERGDTNGPRPKGARRVEIDRGSVTPVWSRGIQPQ